MLTKNSVPLDKKILWPPIFSQVTREIFFRVLEPNISWSLFLTVRQKVESNYALLCLAFLNSCFSIASYVFGGQCYVMVIDGSIESVIHPMRLQIDRMQVHRSGTCA